MQGRSSGMSRLEYHVLLSMAEGARYGYAIKESVEAESGGTLTPKAASLYRVLGRLMTSGLVREAASPGDVEPHPGKERKYYGLTSEGRTELAAEASRLASAAALAHERLGTAGGGA